MSKKWQFLAGMGEGDHWKNRMLFKDWVNGWNRKVYSSQSAKRYDEARKQAREWYKNNLHLKPGPASERILTELKLSPQPARTTVRKWIKDLATAEHAGKGRPKKK